MVVGMSAQIKQAPTTAMMQIEQIKLRLRELETHHNRISKFNEALDRALEGMEKIVEAVALAGEAQGEYWDAQLSLVEQEQDSLKQIVKELESGGARIQPVTGVTIKQ